MKNIFIYGKPGIGKTTLIKRVCSKLSEVGGFFTEEIREGRTRVGFRVESFDGAEGILSHVSIQSRFKVGKYGVDVEAFEKIGVASIEQALKNNKLIVIDEIGKMELFSERFKEVVKKALDSPQNVLATVPFYSIPFVDSLKMRRDVRLFEVTFKNRDSLEAEILRIVS